MTGYTDPEPDPEHYFRSANSRTRARGEIIIDMLKSQFQFLCEPKVVPERACDISVACVILYNIATITGEQHPVIQLDLETIQSTL